MCTVVTLTFVKYSRGGGGRRNDSGKLPSHIRSRDGTKTRGTSRSMTNDDGRSTSTKGIRILATSSFEGGVVSCRSRPRR